MKKYIYPLMGVLGVSILLPVGYLYIKSNQRIDFPDKIATEDVRGGKHANSMILRNSSGNQSNDPNKIELSHAMLKDIRLTADSARILLERCEEEIPDLAKRSLMCQLIVGSLCRQGLATEAWALISRNPGSVRLGEIHSFFLESKSLGVDGVLGYLKELEDPSDRRISLDALLQSRPEVVMDLDPYIFSKASIQERLGIVGGLSRAFQQNLDPKTEHALVDRLMQLTAEGAIDPVSLTNIIRNSSGYDSFTRWEMLGKHQKTFDPKSFEKVQSSLAKDMVSRNPDQALRVICSDASTKYSYPVLSSAIQQYYSVSQDDANKWITSNLDKLDPTTSEHIISVVAQQANLSNEFETARMWASRITNAEVRQQLFEQVDKREAGGLKEPGR